MTDPRTHRLDELAVDAANLYREDVFTDLAVATIRRLTPVREDGTDDPARPVVFVAATQLMTQVGPLPVSAEIEAKDLRDAIAKFPEAIRKAVERLMEETREMQRREASRLVVPGPGTLPPPGKSGLSFK